MCIDKHITPRLAQ
jgi:hypothetical protein